MSSMTIGIIFIGVVLLIIGVLIYRYVTPRLMEGDNGQYEPEEPSYNKRSLAEGGPFRNTPFYPGTVGDDADKRSWRSWDEREL